MAYNYLFAIRFIACKDLGFGSKTYWFKVGSSQYKNKEPICFLSITAAISF
jgi:hypothetical protein